MDSDMKYLSSKELLKRRRSRVGTIVSRSALGSGEIRGKLSWANSFAEVNTRLPEVKKTGNEGEVEDSWSMCKLYGDELSTPEDKSKEVSDEEIDKIVDEMRKIELGPSKCDLDDVYENKGEETFEYQGPSMTEDRYDSWASHSHVKQNLIPLAIHCIIVVVFGVLIMDWQSVMSIFTWRQTRFERLRKLGDLIGALFYSAFVAITVAWGRLIYDTWDEEKGSPFRWWYHLACDLWKGIRYKFVMRSFRQKLPPQIIPVAASADWHLLAIFRSPDGDMRMIWSPKTKLWYDVGDEDCKSFHNEPLSCLTFMHKNYKADVIKTWPNLPFIELTEVNLTGCEPIICEAMVRYQSPDDDRYDFWTWANQVKTNLKTQVKFVAGMLGFLYLLGSEGYYMMFREHGHSRIKAAWLTFYDLVVKFPITVAVIVWQVKWQFLISSLFLHDPRLLWGVLKYSGFYVRSMVLWFLYQRRKKSCHKFFNGRELFIGTFDKYIIGLVNMEGNKMHGWFVIYDPNSKVKYLLPRFGCKFSLMGDSTCEEYAGDFVKYRIHEHTPGYRWVEFIELTVQSEFSVPYEYLPGDALPETHPLHPDSGSRWHQFIASSMRSAPNEEETPDESVLGYQGPDESIVGFLADALAGLEKDMYELKLITDVVALSMLLIETRKPAVLTTQAVALIARYPSVAVIVGGEVERLCASIDKMLNAEPQYQGFIESGIGDTNVGAAFFDLISFMTASGFAATLGLVDIAAIKRLQTLAAHMSSFDSLDKLLRKLGVFIKRLVEVVKRCIDAGSLAPLWETNTISPARYCELANQLVNEVSIRDSSSLDGYKKRLPYLDKDLKSGQVSEQMRVDMMEELLQLGKRFDGMKRGEHDEFIYAQIQVARASLRKEIDAVNARLETNRFRVDPYSEAWIGPPGIGKSHLVRSAARIVARWLNVDDSSTIAYQKNPGRKFMDGLMSSHRLYVYDDVDQKPGAPSYADESPYLDWLMSRNSKPGQANMAEATDKGKYPLNALMMLWVSNKLPTFKVVRAHMNDPQAFARRFDSVWVITLKEGVTPEMVDRGEVDDDSWVFTRYGRNTMANNDSDELFYPTKEVIRSRWEFLARLARNFVARMKRERAKLEMMNGKDGNVCSCGIHFVDHGTKSKCPDFLRDNRVQEWESGVEVPVYQGPSEDPLMDVAMSAQGDVSDEEKLNWFISLSSKVIAGLYFLHVLTMLYGFYFMSVMLEFCVLSSGAWIASLSDEDRLKMAIAFFPRQALLWIIARGLLSTKVPSMVSAIESIHVSRMTSKLKVIAPALAIAAAALIAWRYTSQKKQEEYQSMVAEPETGEEVREQPKSNSWELLSSTPRNVATNRAKTYSLEGAKRLVESSVAVILVRGRPFPLNYAQSKTWFTNAHHLLAGGSKIPYKVDTQPFVFEFPMTCKVKIGTFEGDVILDAENCAQSKGKDVVYMRLDTVPVPGVGVSVLMPGDVDVNAEYADGLIFNMRNRDKPEWQRLSALCKPVKPSGAGRIMYRYSIDSTEGGDGTCGSLVLVPNQGGGYLVVCMHSAGTAVVGIGEPLTRSSLITDSSALYEGSVRKASDVIEYQAGMLRDPSQAGPNSDVVLKPTFARTHLGSALSVKRQVLALGSLRNFHARTFKSDVIDTPHKALVVKFAAEQGINANYTSPQKLTVKKLPGNRILSPFTNQIENRSNVLYRKDALNWARKDYLAPITSFLRQTKPFRLASYTEAMDGLEDLTPVNLDTSTGPPYNTVKSNYLKNVDGEWYVQSDFMGDMDKVARVVADGAIPGAVINTAVKAEAISDSKVEECRQRILEVAPACFSIELKRLLGWLVDVVSKNKSLFEMSIGINPYGLDAERLYDRMKRGPIFAGDFKMQDGSISSQFMDEITSMILEMSEAAGCPPDLLEELRLRLLGFGDRLVCVLGDIFAACGNNPTGWYGTSLFASLTTILVLRCAFYLEHESVFSTEPATTYRENVNTEVLGDDNENCVYRANTSIWFNGNCVRDWAAKYGFKYTSAQKDSNDINWETVDEVQYLKRSFRKEGTNVVMALELKSCAKQLMFYRKPKNGSSVSQMAVNLTNVARELSLHGKKVFDEWMVLFEEICKGTQIKESRFYQVLSWDQTFLGVISGSLAGIKPEEVLESLEYQSTAGPNVDFDVASTTETTTVAPPSTVTEAGAEIQEPDSAQHRFVRVRNQTLATTDTLGTVMASFELVSTMLGNTQLADVMQRFYSFSYESITLRVQHNSPGNMYGQYAIVAVPETQLGPNTVVNFPAYYNMAHCKYFYAFNPANNEDIEFVIPWICQHDMTSTNTGIHNEAPAVRVEIICMCPLTDSIISAGSATGSLVLMAKFNHVRFGAPLYQGPKNSVKLSQVLETAGTIGSAIATFVPGAQPALPIMMGLAAAGKAAAEAGHTRHTAPQAPTRLLDAGVSCLGAVDGEDRAPVSDWIQAATVTTESSFANCGASGDDMDVGFLAGRRHLVGDVGWDNSKAQGYVLMTLPVTPYISKVSTTARCYHPLAHATLMCGFWRATMNYDFNFACNSIQSGSIFVYWSPNFVTVGSTVSTDFISGSVGCMLELDPKKTTRVKVPWMNVRPVAKVYPTLAGSAALGNDVVNGYLVVVVMNPLTTPFTQTVRAFVHTSVGEDVIIGGARAYWAYNDTTGVTSEVKMVLQGTLTQGGSEEVEAWIAGPGAPVTVDGVVLSARIHSIRVLAQRFSGYQCNVGGLWLGGSSAADEGWRTTLSLPFYPTPPCSSGGWLYNAVTGYTRSVGVASTLTTGSTVGFTMIGWLGPMFLGARGGMSWRVVPVPTNGSLTLTQPLVSSIKMYEHQGYPINIDARVVSGALLYYPMSLHGVTQWQRANYGQAFEVILPYNSESRFYPICCIPTTNAASAKWAVLQLSTAGDVGFHVLSGGAADFSLVGFRFAPYLPDSVS